MIVNRREYSSACPYATFLTIPSPQASFPHINLVNLTQNSIQPHLLTQLIMFLTNTLRIRSIFQIRALIVGTLLKDHQKHYQTYDQKTTFDWSMIVALFLFQKNNYVRMLTRCYIRNNLSLQTVNILMNFKRKEGKKVSSPQARLTHVDLQFGTVCHYLQL